jgi:hypothetical protein
MANQRRVIYRDAVPPSRHLAVACAFVLTLILIPAAAASQRSIPSDHYYACRGSQFRISFAGDRLKVSSGSREVASVDPSHSTAHCTGTKGPRGQTSYVRGATSKSTKLLCSTTQSKGRYILEVYRSATHNTIFNVGWAVSDRGSTSLFTIVRATLNPHTSSLSYWTACSPTG